MQKAGKDVKKYFYSAADRSVSRRARASALRSGDAKGFALQLPLLARNVEYGLNVRNPDKFLILEIF